MAWPAALAAMGTFIGGASQAGAAGSQLFGGSGRNQYSGRRHRKAISNQMHQTAYSARYENEGFHPLTMMGISPSAGPPPVRVGNNKGRAMQNMGQGINKMMQAGQSEIQKAQIRNLDARTDYVNAQAAQLAKNAPQGQAGISEVNLPLGHPSYSSGQQKGKAVQGLEQLYRTGDMIVAMPAEGAQDFMSESLFAMIPYMIKQTKQMAFTGKGAYSDKDLTKFRDKLNKVEDFLRSQKEIRPDEYLQWDMDSGQVMVTQSTKKKKKLFKGRAKTYKQQMYTQKITLQLMECVANHPDHMIDI